MEEWQIEVLEMEEAMKMNEYDDMELREVGITPPKYNPYTGEVMSR